jgi:glutamate synthase domain-containing protein 2
VTREIAEIRGLEVGETVVSPPGHSAFSTPRELQGHERNGHHARIHQRGRRRGRDGAPLEFTNSICMPARDAWIFVHSALRGVGLRDRIKIDASGRILTGFHILRALAIGADVCASACGMMFAFGCIEVLRCNTNRCPTGITTQNPSLANELVFSDKSWRAKSFHERTIGWFLELLGARAREHPDDLRPHRVFRRVDDLLVRNYSELYNFLGHGQLLHDDDVPHHLRDDWKAATPDLWRL